MNEFAGSKILIVDDDPIFRLMLRRFLEKNEYTVCEAYDGQHAIEVFKRESPEMVLMDAVMPVLNGLEACRLIREMDVEESCPVLMITAVDDDAFISKAFAAGAADYVRKPLHWAVLGQRIRYKLKVGRAVQVLQASEERFRLLFHKSPLAYQSLDADGNIHEVNLAWLEMLGYDESQVLHQSFVSFLHVDDRARFLANFPAFKERGYENNVHYKMLNSDQACIDIELNGRIGFDLKGNFKQTHCIIQNITERKVMESELKRLATTDSLTGISNRRFFIEEARRICLQCIRFHHPLTMMMLDIDHFKLINDNHGHDVGDRVLQQVTRVIQQSLREVDVLGRIGGEEFALVFPETASVEAGEVAERIRSSIEALHIEVQQGFVHVTVSIGVINLSSDDETVEVLLKKADELLYVAKNEGRNLVRQESVPIQ